MLSFSSSLQLPLLPVQILLPLLLLVLWVLPDSTTHAWVIVVPTNYYSRSNTLLLSSSSSSSRMTALYSTADASTGATTSFLKQTLKRQILPTNRGRSTTLQQREDLQQTLDMLETTASSSSSSTMKAPARSKLVEGTWVVEYTTAPPPSNGVLGIFQGIARQRIELDSKKYYNLLSVGDNIISAELVARWEEWDGILLQDAKQDGRWKGDGVGIKNDAVGEEETIKGTTTKTTLSTPPKKAPTNMMESFMSSLFDKAKSSLSSSAAASTTPDYGATCWVVTFETLEIQLFGITLLQQKFNDNVKRVWRTTYIDDDTRIVRAGRTGNREDEMVFYMTRDIK